MSKQALKTLADKWEAEAWQSLRYQGVTKETDQMIVTREYMRWCVIRWMQEIEDAKAAP